jgi:type IV pilus assembly protein PilX
VVLVVCLVVLLALSLTAAVSVRGAGSSDAVAGHARTQAQALAAAEAALGHCERQVLAHLADPAAGIEPAPADADGGYRWQRPAAWDVDPGVVQIPFDTADAGDRADAAVRPPECLVEAYDAARPGSFVVSARGFGPEVRMADATAGPTSGATGTEVHLQTVVFTASDAAGQLRVERRWWRQLMPIGR